MYLQSAHPLLLLGASYNIVKRSKLLLLERYCRSHVTSCHVTSAVECIFGGKFTSSTQLTKSSICFPYPMQLRGRHFSRNQPPGHPSPAKSSITGERRQEVLDFQCHTSRSVHEVNKPFHSCGLSDLASRWLKLTSPRKARKAGKFSVYTIYV